MAKKTEKVTKTENNMGTDQPADKNNKIIRHPVQNEIAYQNKDIASKALAERLKGKSFQVYGLDLPEIAGTGPTNIPMVTAHELRLDNLFYLADHTVAIVDYESRYNKADKVKYLNYLTGIANRYLNEKKECPQLRMIVIYTGDVKRSQVSEQYDIGAVKMNIETAFLSELDSDNIFRRLEAKIRKGLPLTDEELMEFIILPLSYQSNSEKEQKAREMAKLSEAILNREQQIFVITGLLVFTDKVIDEKTANKMKEVLNMTKVERMIREDLREEVEQEVRQEIEQEVRQEVEQEVRQEVEQEVRQEVEQEVRQEVEQEVRQEVEQEVRQEVEQEVRQKVKQEAERKAVKEKQQFVIRLIEKGTSTNDIVYIIPEYTHDTVEAIRSEYAKSNPSLI